MKVIDCVQGSAEWLEARRGLATASCFSKILAKGQGKTRASYLMELVGQRLTEGPLESGYQSAEMRIGQEREPLACAAYEARTRQWTTEVGFCRHDTLEVGASPDRLVGDKRLLEVKAPGVQAHLAILESRAVPSEYIAQVMGELWVCERSELDFVSFNPSFREEEHRLVIVEVRRDEPYIDRLRTEVAIFMEEVRAKVKALGGEP